MRYRIEKDELGELKIPMEAYYGIHTLRSKNLFSVSKRPICRQMIKALALCKKAAAWSNFDAGKISKSVKDAISLSCDEILNGRLHGQFITDLIQGGAGTAMNMNANEVIANRANEMLGSVKGKYDLVKPIDDVNKNQSANDVVITSGKLTAVRLCKKLLVEMKKLLAALKEKAHENPHRLFNSKTHLTDNIYLKYNEYFLSLYTGTERHITLLEEAIKRLYKVCLGGGAIGNGFGIDDKYAKKVCAYLSEFTSQPYEQAENLVDSQMHIDDFLTLESAVFTFSSFIYKIAHDFILMGSAYNLFKIPSTFPGSSSIPLKENPVVLEMIMQVIIYMNGNHLTITQGILGGEMQLNTSLPIILACLFENLNFIRRAIRSLRENVLVNLKLKNDADSLNEMPLISFFINDLGYEEAVKLLQKAQTENIDIISLLKSDKRIKPKTWEAFYKKTK